MSSAGLPSSSSAATLPAPVRLTAMHWTILVMAAIGFAFDTYAILVLPIVARPGLARMLDVDPDTASGNDEILKWTGYVMWGSAICGGVFGLLGGYLTDRLGRRRVLTWSILLYAFSAVGAGYATSPWLFLVLRCSTFVGVCLEFVAAVAWLAELFPNPHQRETILGYTQAFSSVGGLLISATYWIINQFASSLPTIYGEHEAWRYTLISGIIPAIPLIVVRPFLPESPVWQRKHKEGTLKRPSLAEIFRGRYLRVSLISAALFACGFGAAFGAIQMTPQIVPGLVPELAPLPGLREAFEGAKDEKKRDQLKERYAKLQKEYDELADKDTPEAQAKQKLLDRADKAYKGAVAGSKSEEKRDELKDKVASLQQQQEKTVSSVQFWQEIGGLAGRFLLAFLAVRLLSRRKLLWCFQLPGLLIVPLVYFFPAAGKFSSSNLEILRVGMFFAGFFTVAQFSFWGNYLPLMYPTHLRGTGEGFAANVGGRMFGTGANFLTTRLAIYLLAAMPLLARPTGIAYAAGIVALAVYALGSILTYFLPEPKPGAAQE